MASAFVTAAIMEKDEPMWGLLESGERIRAAEILLLAYDKSLNIDGILRSSVIDGIKKIETEKVLRSGGGGGGISMSDRTSGGGRSSRINHRRGGGDGDGAFHHGHGADSGAGNSGMPIMRKPVIKKKATSFDQAMKQKIMSELNKISEQNYKEIFDSIDAIYGRLSADEHPWVLHLVLENASIQHVFAELYVTLFREIIVKNKDDMEMARDIIMDFYKEHREKILTNVSNGENYDDFCEANKLKTSLIGLSIVLGEAANQNLVLPQEVGNHAISLVKILGEIRDKSTDVPKETTENGVTCVLEFFKIVGKTKAGKPGFQECLRGIDELLTVEKTDKKLTPKARFAIMDFVDGMKKLCPPLTLVTSILSPAHPHSPSPSHPLLSSHSPSAQVTTAPVLVEAHTESPKPVHHPVPALVPQSPRPSSPIPASVPVPVPVPVSGGGTGGPGLSKAFPSVSYRQLVNKVA